MSQRIDAIFENGVFRPNVPVNMANGQRVSLSVESQPLPTDDLGDVADLLDAEVAESCRKNSRNAPSLEEVWIVLNAFDGSLADRISAERNEQ
jgi:predicted DNA-binding antitoxin AbrB/MazE fold protein